MCALTGPSLLGARPVLGNCAGPVPSDPLVGAPASGPRPPVQVTIRVLLGPREALPTTQPRRTRALDETPRGAGCGRPTRVPWLVPACWPRLSPVPSAPGNAFPAHSSGAAGPAREAGCAQACGTQAAGLPQASVWSGPGRAPRPRRNPLCRGGRGRAGEGVFAGGGSSSRRRENNSVPLFLSLPRPLCV